MCLTGSLKVECQYKEREDGAWKLCQDICLVHFATRCTFLLWITEADTFSTNTINRKTIFYSFSCFHISIQICRHISYIQLKTEKTMAIYVAVMYLKLFEAKNAETDTKTIYQAMRGCQNEAFHTDMS